MSIRLKTLAAMVMRLTGQVTVSVAFGDGGGVTMADEKPANCGERIGFGRLTGWAGSETMAVIDQVVWVDVNTSFRLWVVPIFIMLS